MADIFVKQGEKLIRYRVFKDLGFDPKSKLYHKAVVSYTKPETYAAYSRTRRGPWQIVGGGPVPETEKANEAG